MANNGIQQVDQTGNEAFDIKVVDLADLVKEGDFGDALKSTSYSYPQIAAFLAEEPQAPMGDK